MQKTYIDGLNDAWALVRKIFTTDCATLQKALGHSDESTIIMLLEPQKVLELFEAYEKEQAQIKVGDVVERMNFTELFAVSGFNEGTYTLINANGRCVCANVNQMKKTGKHIDIEKILGQLRGE